jgi:hypothetical protein
MKRLKQHYWVGLILYLLVNCSISLACEVLPDKLIQSLATEKPETIIAKLWDGKDCEEKLLNGLSSGKPEWIKLALALQPNTDAWASESLESSIGDAMLKAPSRLLPLIRDYSFNESICLPSMWDDSGKSDNKYRKQIRLARPMFEAFLKTSLRPEAEKCLEEVSRIEQGDLFIKKHD